NQERIGGGYVWQVCAVPDCLGVPGADRAAAAAGRRRRSRADQPVQRGAAVEGADSAPGPGWPALGSCALGLGTFLGEGQAAAGDQCPGRDGGERQVLQTDLGRWPVRDPGRWLVRMGEGSKSPKAETALLHPQKRWEADVLRGDWSVPAGRQ